MLQLRWRLVAVTLGTVVANTFIFPAPSALYYLSAAACLASVWIHLRIAIAPSTWLAILAAAWTIVSYAWLQPEICKRYIPTSMARCDTFWMSQPIAVLWVARRTWLAWSAAEVEWEARASGATPREEAVSLGQREKALRALLLFPIIAGVGTALVFYTLLCPNTFWMQPKTPYTKWAVLDHVPPAFSLGNVLVRAPLQIPEVAEELGYPLVLKPNQCSRSSKFVVPIDDEAQFRRYLELRTEERPEADSLAQHLFRDGGEATLWYYRWPYSPRGGLKTVWVKQYTEPWALDPLRAELIKASPPNASHVDRDLVWHVRRDEAVVDIRDDLAHESPALLDAVEQIMAEQPGSATMARLDVKFDTVDDLAEGRFKVLEMDLPPFGDRREKDRESSEWPAYGGPINSARQVRTMVLQMYMGFCNVMVGHALGPLTVVPHLSKLVGIAVRCEYHGSMAPITPGLM
jgi:hypothetical protein